MSIAQVNRSAKLALAMILIGFVGCIQLRPISLYEGEEAAPVIKKPASIAKVVEPILFQDDTLDVWGILADSCKNFQLVEDVKHSGNASLKLRWDQSGCEFIGFGMGWDGYAGKNLEPLLNYAAFQMYIRTPKGKAFGLPFVLTLEDYSGVMAFCYTGNKYFERTTLDEEWQKVTVPLKDFDDEGEGIDFGNIKQLQIELQQSGDVYLDDVQLVFFEEEKIEAWLEKEKLPDLNRLPITMFGEEFINQNAWGLVETPCQTVKVTDQQAYEGNNSIHAIWDHKGEESCSLPLFGVSWAKWQAVDIRPILADAKLSFYLKADNLSELAFQLYLEDFNRSKSAVIFQADWAKPAKDGWYHVEVPMLRFLGANTISEVAVANASDGSGSAGAPRNIDPKIIKSLVFKLEGKGEMYIDQLRWE